MTGAWRKPSQKGTAERSDRHHNNKPEQGLKDGSDMRPACGQKPFVGHQLISKTHENGISKVSANNRLKPYEFMLLSRESIL